LTSARDTVIHAQQIGLIAWDKDDKACRDRRRVITLAGLAWIAEAEASDPWPDEPDEPLKPLPRSAESFRPDIPPGGIRPAFRLRTTAEVDAEVGPAPLPEWVDPALRSAVLDVLAAGDWRKETGPKGGSCFRLAIADQLAPLGFGGVDPRDLGPIIDAIPEAEVRARRSYRHRVIAEIASIPGREFGRSPSALSPLGGQSR
jgi:hypothetical protein